ncbi:hypothetical protein WICPIJ_001931 [Wickerhamomyces pijperi]|uniref:Uncharacterized protein n=1 Tax=Wickerhamomyces pijperi TaxID=599730 RepID=A0A9P8QAP2_WICPI|nr:hypothetical protein WICPIJ_001931 [Wickerhamomyces pijperi]
MNNNQEAINNITDIHSSQKETEQNTLYQKVKCSKSITIDPQSPQDNQTSDSDVPETAPTAHSSSIDTLKLQQCLKIYKGNYNSLWKKFTGLRGELMVSEKRWKELKTLITRRDIDESQRCELLELLTEIMRQIDTDLDSHRSTNPEAEAIISLKDRRIHEFETLTQFLSSTLNQCNQRARSLHQKQFRYKSQLSKYKHILKSQNQQLKHAYDTLSNYKTGIITQSEQIQNLQSKLSKMNPLVDESALMSPDNQTVITKYPDVRVSVEDQRCSHSAWVQENRDLKRENELLRSIIISQSKPVTRSISQEKIRKT